MAESLKKTQNGIENRLNGMIDRASGMQGFLDRVIFRLYQNAQRQRWMTENQSEGEKWRPLSPGYDIWKKKKFASFPGGGEKMLIATNRLFPSVVGESGETRKVVTNRGLVVATTVPYAPKVAEIRPFMKFGKATIDKMKKSLRDYIARKK